MSKEIHTMVVYDIVVDAVRTKIAEACKDFGLVRFQYSAFIGKLDRTMRKELYARLSTELGETPGRFLVLPICESDYASRMELEIG